MGAVALIRVSAADVAALGSVAALLMEADGTVVSAGGDAIGAVAVRSAGPLRSIDWLLALPAGAEREVREAIARLEEERQMPYTISIERMARGGPGGGAARCAAGG